MSLSPDEAAELVRRAAGGDSQAWADLVRAYGPMIWAMAYNHRLDARDAADVSQSTWLRLIEHIDRLDQPGRVGAWLATTAGRECLRVRHLSRRYVLVEDYRELEPRDGGATSIEDLVVAMDQRERVRGALEELPEKQRALLDALMADPHPHYEEIAKRLGMPVGSIGPTRGRCLRRLRPIMELHGVAST